MDKEITNVTDYFLTKTDKLKVIPEVTPGNHGFSMYNGGSTEVEVSEFLYGLCKMLKPKYIQETGCHAGVSAAYMAQALKDNGKGKIVTLEVIPEWVERARALWKDLELDNVECIQQSSLEYQLKEPIELLFLDSEPQLRFDEFIRYWPNVVPGGFILIHDLNNLGLTNETHHEVFSWPFGDFRPKIGKYIRDFDVQTISFPTPRGFVLFQKTKKDSLWDYLTNYWFERW